MSNTRRTRKLITAPADWRPAGQMPAGVPVGGVDLTPAQDPADVFADEPETMLAWYAPMTELPPEQYEERVRAAHTLVMSGTGLWLPLPLPGYLKDGGLPGRAIAMLFEAAEAGLLTATESVLEHPGLPEALRTVHVLGARDGRRRFNLNLVGSILSWMIGRAPYPWHGPVAFMAAPGDDGIRRKLTWQQKAFLLTCAEAVIATLLGEIPSTGPLAPVQIREIRDLTAMIYEMDQIESERQPASQLQIATEVPS